MSDELEPATIPIESIRRLDVKPGETLVFKVDPGTYYDDKALRKLAEDVTGRLPKGVQVLILAGAVDVAGVISSDTTALEPLPGADA